MARKRLLDEEGYLCGFKPMNLKPLSKQRRQKMLRRLALYLEGRHIEVYPDKEDSPYYDADDWEEFLASLLPQKDAVRAIVAKRLELGAKELLKWNPDKLKQEIETTIAGEVDAVRTYLTSQRDEAVAKVMRRAQEIADTNLEKWAKERIQNGALSVERKRIVKVMEVELRKQLDQVVKDFVAQISFKLNAPGGRKLIVGQDAA